MAVGFFFSVSKVKKKPYFFLNGPAIKRRTFFAASLTNPSFLLNCISAFDEIYVNNIFLQTKCQPIFIVVWFTYLLFAIYLTPLKRNDYLKCELCILQLVHLLSAIMIS